MFVRDVLAEEAVEVAPIEEQSEVQVAVFRAVAVGILRVPGTRSRRTKPGRATVRDLWIQIRV
jgi:hypothetical protein